MAVRDPYTTRIATDEFVGLPDNPRQRDTEKRARKAHQKHLKTYIPPHGHVFAAEINGRLVCKLDGHTRSYLWSQNNGYYKPSVVTLTVYPCDNMADAADLYSTFDNALATETALDRMSGALRENGISLKSSLFSKGFSTALKIAASSYGKGKDEYVLVKEWRHVIIEIDSWGLPHGPFKGSGLVSLALVTVAANRHDLSEVKDFYTSYASNLGSKQGGLMCGVQALTEHMSWRRENDRMTGFDNIHGMMSKGLSCLNAWCQNQRIKNVQPSEAALKKLQDKAINNIKQGRI